jgi:hypothetical protein
MMLLVELDTATGNRLLEEGRMGEVLEGILGNLKPEAAYFYARGGRRAFTLVVDAPDSSFLPSLAEPFWLKFGAHVEAFPCMNTDELRAGIGRLG